MSGDDTQKYIEQIKEGWNQLSGGVAEQVKSTSPNSSSRTMNTN